jgi:hypothetical protein
MQESDTYMKSTLSAILALAMIGCAQRDPIDRIVDQESSNPFFPSGMYLPIPLPLTASVTQVTVTALGELPVKTLILESRRVRIPKRGGAGEDPARVAYVGVLARTPSGDKVVLLQYRDRTRSWWSRVYNVDRSKILSP